MVIESAKDWLSILLVILVVSAYFSKLQLLHCCGSQWTGLVLLDGRSWMIVDFSQPMFYIWTRALLA